MCERENICLQPHVSSLQDFLASPSNHIRAVFAEAPRPRQAHVAAPSGGSFLVLDVAWCRSDFVISSFANTFRQRRDFLDQSDVLASVLRPQICQNPRDPGPHRAPRFLFSKSADRYIPMCLLLFEFALCEGIIVVQTSTRRRSVRASIRDLDFRSRVARLSLSLSLHTRQCELRSGQCATPCLSLTAKCSLSCF